LANIFGEFDVYPFKEIGAIMPERGFKDGCRVKWLALKDFKSNQILIIKHI